QEVVLLTGSDDGIRLWLNGERIHHNPAVRIAAPDQDRILAKLRRGWNTVLAKVVNDIGGHGLFLRLSAPGGPPKVQTTRRFTLDVQGTAKATLTHEGSGYRIDVTAVDGTDWHVRLEQQFDDLQEGATYTVRFRAKAGAPRQVSLYGQIAEPEWTGIGLSKVVPLTKDWQPYEYKFQAKKVAARNTITFILGAQTGTVWITDFTVTKSEK